MFQKSQKTLDNQNYEIYDDNGYNLAEAKCVFDEQKLTLSRISYQRTDNSDDTYWETVYYCEGGWNLKKIMIALKHHYASFVIECHKKYPKKIEKWITGGNRTPNSSDLKFLLSTTIANQIAEANYVDELYIAHESGELYITWDDYS
jgi:hypothetical protein